MSQKTTYRCDICGAEFTQDAVRGFEFSGKKLVQKPSCQVHRHFCVPCIVAFVDATKVAYEQAMNVMRDRT